MQDDETYQNLTTILQLAYSGERAAGYAYRGHWHSVVNEEERVRIKQIEDEEWHHRELVGEMLRSLDAHPSSLREIRALIIGRMLGLLCHFTGWLAPMYGAGRLESRNIVEYETAARYAHDCGREDFVALKARHVDLARVYSRLALIACEGARAPSVSSSFLQAEC